MKVPASLLIAAVAAYCCCVSDAIDIAAPEAIGQLTNLVVNSINQTNLNLTNVCYGEALGCFYQVAGKSYLLGLPPDPSLQPTQLWLFTQPDDMTTPQIIPYTNESWVGSTQFNPSCRSVFLIHGYSNNASFPWIVNSTAALFQKVTPCVNVMAVNWDNGSNADYIDVSRRAELIGRQLAVMICNMVNYDPKLIHIVGNSMGAQIAGFAGNWTQILCNLTIGRITGVDPAGPLFCNSNVPLGPILVAGYALNKNQADYVDIIHTNGGIIVGPSLTPTYFGCIDSCGHADYYVNGGACQPYCVKNDPTNVWCSHQTSQYYFVNSILNGNDSCRYKSFPCLGPSGYSQFLEGKYFSCDGKCGQMGYWSSGAVGNQCLLTLTSNRQSGRHFKVVPQPQLPLCPAMNVTISNGKQTTSAMTFGLLLQLCGFSISAELCQTVALSSCVDIWMSDPNVTLGTGSLLVTSAIVTDENGNTKTISKA